MRSSKRQAKRGDGLGKGTDRNTTMKYVSTVYLALCSLFFTSCLPVRRVDNALWDAMARDQPTIVLAKMDVANGKLAHHFVSFIKNDKNLSVESVKNSLAPHDLPAEERISGKQAVVLFNESDRVIRVFYVSDDHGRISMDRGDAELKYILRQ